MIDYRLLGPLEVAVDGQVVDVGGLKQRALLTILLLHVNQPVHRDALIDRLWGERPPSGAEHAVDVYISRLRKALEKAAGTQEVLTRPGGYLLQTAPEQLDVARFERLAEDGRRSLAAGDASCAAQQFGAALALCRGETLADFQHEPFAQAEIARLDGLRAAVVEDRIEADLALGNHARVAGELAALVAARPLRERPYQQLMIALYRCGRQADALAVYQQARRTLVDELGIEPGQPLRQLERAILQQDPSLEPPPGAGARPVPSPGRSGPPGLATGSGPKRLLAVAVAAVAVVALLAGGVARLRASPVGLVAGPNTVGVIDDSRNMVAAVVAGVGTPGGVAFGAGATWITDSASDQLVQVGPDHTVIDRIQVGHGPAGLAFGDGEIWVANALDGTVSEVNPQAGAQVAAVQVGNGPDAVAFGFGSVWAANVTDGTLSRIDPDTDRLIATIPLGSAPAGIAAGPQGIWVVSAETGRLLLVDPGRDGVSRVFPAGSSAAGVAVGAHSVWVTDTDGLLYRLDPATGRSQLIHLGGSPAGVVYAAGSIWVANSVGGSLWRVDPRTGVSLSIRVGNQPAGLAAAGRDVVATVLPSLASHRGGTLTLIAGSYPSDLPTDPAVAYLLPLWDMLSVTNDGLVGYSRTGGPEGDTLVPDLATALPVPTGHGTTYTFHLRPGIRYSDGAPVRPEDFRREIERVFDLNHAAAEPTGYFGGIVGAGRCLQRPRDCDLDRGIVANDAADTVTFHLTAPDPEFLYKLAFPFADAVPAGTPAHQVAASQLPATGPYMTQSLVPGHRWVLVRNPRFAQWSAQAQPNGFPSRIVLLFHVSPQQGVSDVQDRRADVLLSPPADRMQELATQSASRLHAGPTAATVGLVLNTRAWPFSVPDARRALNDAIDRAKMIALIGGPLLAQPTCQILPPGMPGYRPYCPYTLDPSPSGAWAAPDLAHAEQLVRASGTRGARVTVLAGGFGTTIPLQATGHYLISVLDQLGYRASLRVIHGQLAYYNQLSNSRRRRQIGWFGWYEDYPAPWDFIGPLLSCSSFRPDSPANLNESEFCDRDVDAQAQDALAVQARAANVADGLWTRIDHEITDAAPWVPLWTPRTLLLLSARVGNYQFDPYFTLLIDQLWVR